MKNKKLTKMTKHKKIKIYENALINIIKLGGVCWDGDRKCSDSQNVALETLKQGNPELIKEIDEIKWWFFKINKKGKVSWKKT